MATTGIAALAIAGLTAAVFLGVATPTTTAAATVPAPTAISKTTIHTSSTSDGGSGTHGSNAHGGSNAYGGGHHGQDATPTQQEILRWQTDLSKLSYYDGPLDGVMSAETHNSIRLLQGDAGLTQTGDMDVGTRAAMQSMLAHQNHGGDGQTHGNHSGSSTDCGHSDGGAPQAAGRTILQTQS